MIHGYIITNFAFRKGNKKILIYLTLMANKQFDPAMYLLLTKVYYSRSLSNAVPWAENITA